MIGIREVASFLAEEFTEDIFISERAKSYIDPDKCEVVIVYSRNMKLEFDNWEVEVFNRHGTRIIWFALLANKGNTDAGLVTVLRTIFPNTHVQLKYMGRS